MADGSEPRQIHSDKRHSWSSRYGFWRARNLQDPKALEAAAEEHDRDRIEQAERHNSGDGRSQYLAPFIYGALDGITTTFAVVGGVVGAELSSSIILIMGLANLLGDGFSMASGAYLSARTEREVYVHDRRNEVEQIVRAPHKEKGDLYRIYRHDFPEQEAKSLTEIVSEDPGRWVSTMTAEKHLLLPQKRKPPLEGLATFAGFVTAGTVPLLVYLVDMAVHSSLSATTSFLIATVLSGLALLAAGAAKVFVTERSPVRSSLEMLLVGSLAAAVAFGVGALIKNLVGMPT
ncbi:MAG: VIT1/CCC1 transporter family protein [Chloroflexi bacterium]|nr:VIT1/CCC1 transporter family protein [Chloroflexota bacterium]